MFRVSGIGFGSLIVPSEFRQISVGPHGSSIVRGTQNPDVYVFGLRA